MVNLSSWLPRWMRSAAPAALVGSLALASCDVGTTSEKPSGTGAGGAAPSGGMTTTDSSADSSTGAGVGGATVASGASTSGGETSAATTGGSTTSGGGGSNHLAPNGYYVLGNTINDASKQPHVLHGMARPSMEWSATGEHVGSADFQIMKSWGARIVRIALNQDFWLAGAAKHNGAYAANVDQAVQQARQLGLDVILDLHWSDRGDLQNQGPGQQRMADQNSITFWSEVAAKYKGDGRVLFELYNEPHDVPPAVWLSGGKGGQADYAAAGMQQLHDAVRGAGAENLVIVGGLGWAFDLSHVADYPVQGHNILYATHPYNNSAERQPAKWSGSFGYLAKTAPVIVTEFGDGSGSCSPAWDQQVIAYADAHHVSWTAWAWWSGDCKFPSLLTDWKGGTTKEGDVVKAALLGYADPAPTRAPSDAGADAAGE